MKVYAILNRTTYNTYSYRVLSNYIYEEKQIGKDKFKICWDLPSQIDKRLLIKALNNRDYLVKDVEGEEK